MKLKAIVPLLAVLAAPAVASDYTDSAPVVSSVPLYQTVREPQQQCWTESVTRYEEHRSPGGAIIGGLTGGLLGNTVGRGDGRVASTAVGAVIGALVGDHIANRDSRAVAVRHPVERCQTVETQRQIVTGYQVTYYYNGRHNTVVLPYDPGARVPVQVSVAGAPYVSPPVEYVVYEQRRAPKWRHKPYKHPHRERDWHR